MKGTPRSLWLSAANRAASWWTGAATAAMRRQQNAVLAALLPKPGRTALAPPRRHRKGGKAGA